MTKLILENQVVIMRLLLVAQAELAAASSSVTLSDARKRVMAGLADRIALTEAAIRAWDGVVEA